MHLPDPVTLGSGLVAEFEEDRWVPGAIQLLVDGTPQSHVNLRDPGDLFFEYIRRIGHVIDLFRSPGAPISALHLGGGAFTLPRYIEATRPGSRQQVIELESALVGLVREAAPLPKRASIRVRHGDAREVLGRLPAGIHGAMDLVIVDIFAGSRTPAHVSSAEFYGLIRPLLAPGGVVVVNATDGAGQAFTRGQAATLASIFPEVAAIAEPQVLKGRRFGNVVLVASNEEPGIDWLPRLLAGGPHPARMLAGRELEEWLRGARPVTARRRLAQTAKPRPRAVKPVRKGRGRKYSYHAVKVLQRVWAWAGHECGKYLAVSMLTHLDSLERNGELVCGKARYCPEVRAELLQMSPATIDRYLAPARAKDPLRGISTTRPSPLLRSSITVRKAGDEVENVPGFFEGDTVTHCGPTLKGEFCRTVNLTDMNTGWVFTRSIRNNVHVHVLATLQLGVETIPFEVTGLDFDNGSEFINHDVIGWAASRKIFFTRSRPYKKNDQATIESKNNHLVRRYGFY